jgi:2-oxo-4-hydroxy-4-carboxy-5-ureidoimidazoline decarboxylase
MSAKTALSAVAALDEVEFVARFGDIAEHSPWVAEKAFACRPFADRDAVIEAFQRAVAQAEPAAQLALLRAHPDLAGRAAIAGDLAPESAAEQKGAGLDRLTAAEFARFTALNEAYKVRFGFPFIFAVRGATKERILQSFEDRVGGAAPEELLTALAQVCRIIRFRLEDRIEA